MIKTINVDELIKRLAAVITYGMQQFYSEKVMEEKIANSPLINNLEKGQFVYNESLEKCIEDTYKIKLFSHVDISFRALFISESYIRLFFKFNKSFEYLFLYWPIEYSIDKYGVYHEMDFSHLLFDFEKKVNDTSLLKKLSKEKNIKYTEISKLTGINLNTIVNYSRNDKNLYSAPFKSINKLATLFRVKENLFLESLDVYVDNSIYLSEQFNESFRNYFGLYFADYFDSNINGKDYIFFQENKCFISKSNQKLKVLVQDKNKIDISGIISESDSSTYLVIFLSGFFANKFVDYSIFNIPNVKEIMIISPEEVYIVKKGIRRDITDTVYKMLYIRAKNSENI